MGRRGAGSLRDGCLITHGLPASIAADPDAGIAIGSAEIFAKLVAFDVGAGGNNGGVTVDAHHHIRNIHGFVAKLATAAGGDGFLFGGDLAERGNGDIIFGESAQGEFGVAPEAGFFGLALHVDDLADRVLVGGL